MFDIQTEPSDLDIDGQRVDVYKNLQDECLSIKSRNTDSDDSAESEARSSSTGEQSSTDYGNVIGHADFVLLEDVEFVVQDAGQERARETGVKNVHAMVRGTVKATDANAEIEWNLMVRMFGNDICNVNYDPFETDSFEVMDAVRVDEHEIEEGDEIDGALYASVTENGVGAMLPSGDDT